MRDGYIESARKLIFYNKKFETIFALINSFEHCFWNLFIYLFVLITFIIGFSRDSSWFSCTLVMIIWEISDAKELFYTVYENIDKLFISIIIATIFLYWFAIIGYNSSW